MQCSDGSVILSGKPLSTYEAFHALGFHVVGQHSQIQGTEYFCTCSLKLYQVETGSHASGVTLRGLTSLKIAMWSVSLLVSQLPGTRFLSQFFPFTLQPLHPLTQSNSVNQPFSQSYCSQSLSVCQRLVSVNQLVNQSVIRSQESIWQWPVSQSVIYCPCSHCLSVSNQTVSHSVSESNRHIN